VDVEIKFCGLTRSDDVAEAGRLGAAYAGVILASGPRLLTIERAREVLTALHDASGTPRRVGVFGEQDVESISRAASAIGLDVVQLHGDEQPLDGAWLDRPLFRSTTIDDAEELMALWPVGTPLLLDATDRDRRGGTGTTVDWTRAAALARRRRIILAGGLTPENVAEAIAQAQPWGVDVVTGVEASPGRKDPRKLRAFIAAAKATEPDDEELVEDVFGPAPYDWELSE